MKKITINEKQPFLFIILLCSIFPVVNILSFEMPILYFIIPIEFFLVLFILFGWIKVPKVVWIIILFLLLMIVEIFISALYGSVTFFNEFIFPSDIIQYVAKIFTMLTCTVIFYRQKIKTDTFIKYFLIVLNIGMLIGILQWIPWPGREAFIMLYPFREGTEQLGQLTRSLSGIRVHGVAQFATANGGLATFFFIYGFSIFKYYNAHKCLSLSLMTLSLINIFASQSRGGMLALVFSFLLFYLVDIYITKRKLKTTVTFILGFIFICIIGFILFKNENLFVIKMVDRWNNLFDTNGGARVNQIQYFLSLFTSGFQYVFGLSKPVVNQSIISYGIEIEPANIFILYGIAGFILQYGLIAYLATYFLKKLKNTINDKAILPLLIASFVGLLSYQVFSVAYFFFRETRVGLFPWILMGVTIGVYEKHKKNYV